MVIEKIILISVVLATINFFITIYFAKNNVSNYFKSQYKYYNTKVVTRQFNRENKEEVKFLQSKLFDTQMKLLALYIKPIILQFIVLIFGLQILRSYDGFVLSMNIFGWVPGYFAVYFVTYILMIRLLRASSKKFGY